MKQMLRDDENPRRRLSSCEAGNGEADKGLHDERQLSEMHRKRHSRDVRAGTVRGEDVEILWGEIAGHWDLY
jgi:hypothetical protein